MKFFIVLFLLIAGIASAAAPTLETNAGADTLRITDGTSGNPVTWNDVWDWDDGGGSSGGDGDVPKDGGGTVKVNTFMTEIVADAMYVILKDIDFGDEATSTYFQSIAEMVYFEDGFIFQVKSNATLECGNLLDGWGVRGSFWSLDVTGDLLEPPQTGTFLFYSSMFNNRKSSGLIDFEAGDVDIRNSILYGIGDFQNDQFRFRSDLTSIILNKVFFNSNTVIGLVPTPDIANDVHIHNQNFGVITLADTTIKGFLATSINLQEARQFAANTLTIQDPQVSLTSVRIDNASGDIIEQYTTNIHVTDKDGADLEGVDIDVTYAHLVEGSDSKTYKCIQDHTSVDATHKPITGNDWESFWELFDAGGGLGGPWQTTFDFKANTAEFGTETTDANGDISEQVIQYKKWVGTSEILEARTHKFTYTLAGYKPLIMEDIIFDSPGDWEVQMPEAVGPFGGAWK